jgi:peptidoglycan hydrolase-like protein with peptidoglycan-binding domain/uncharacterized protein YegP (UPF0339 family)
MTRPVWAWASCRARGRLDGLLSRLSGLAVAVVLLCALSSTVASAQTQRRSHGRQAVHRSTSQHLSRRGGSRVPVLRLGSGEQARRGWVVVRRLQHGLARAGYRPGPVDGRFGPLTAAAVERFQANHGLVVDGIVGPVTRRALRAGPVLGLGVGVGSAHGSPAVAHLQHQLARAGFAPGPVDGRFGPRTERAVRAFQRARHLRVDGIAGALTEHALHAGPRLTSQPVSPRGAATPRHSAPAKHVSKPTTRTPASRPARPAAHLTSGPPMVWILIALGVLGLTAVLAGYFQRPIRTRATRIKHTLRKRRVTPQPQPQPLPEPEPVSVKFLLYEDNSGGYYWTIIAEDGELLARSPRFTSYEDANYAADAVYRGVAMASFEDRSESSPPVDPPAVRDAAPAEDRVEPERWLDEGGSVSREQVTRARAAQWAWPAGSSSTPGGRRR